MTRKGNSMYQRRITNGTETLTLVWSDGRNRRATASGYGARLFLVTNGGRYYEYDDEDMLSGDAWTAVEK